MSEVTVPNFCDHAREVASAAAATPEHERGFPLAVLVNHIRECHQCRAARFVLSERIHKPNESPARTEEWGVLCGRQPQNGVMEAGSEVEARRWLVHDADTLMKRTESTSWAPVVTEAGDPDA